MAVVAHVTIPGMTLAQYDELRSTVGWLDDPPRGGIAHFAWEDADGLHGTDVWESEDAWNAFGAERMAPAMAKLGFNSVPQVSFAPAHEVFIPQAVTLK